MHTLISMLILATLSVSASVDLKNLRNEAGAALAAGNIDSATRKLQQILDTVPDDGATHYRIATLLMDQSGDETNAIHHFERARDLNFQPLDATLGLSRIHARAGHRTTALEQLETMADGGFALPKLIEEQSDFDNIRSDPRFTAALAVIQAARFPCAADERHRAFDFWVGEWTVTQNGQFAGTNSVQAILGHCTLFEQRESSNGSSGKSFSYYDPGLDHWRQIWIGDGGSFIEFTGEARDDGIFYTSQTVSLTDGSVTLHQFDFTQMGEDRVRQYWQTSTDGGKTWQPVWDGHYHRRKP